MKSDFTKYDPENPLPFILLFEELPDAESAIDGLLIRKYYDDTIGGIAHKIEFTNSCFCERQAYENRG